MVLSNLMWNGTYSSEELGLVVGGASLIQIRGYASLDDNIVIDVHVAGGRSQRILG